MTEKKAIKAVKRLKKYCASFDECCDRCIFRDKYKYTRNGCMLREGIPPEEYDKLTESEGKNGRAEE